MAFSSVNLFGQTLGLGGCGDNVFNVSPCDSRKLGHERFGGMVGISVSSIKPFSTIVSELNESILLLSLRFRPKRLHDEVRTVASRLLWIVDGSSSVFSPLSSSNSGITKACLSVGTLQQVQHTCHSTWNTIQQVSYWNAATEPR